MRAILCAAALASMALAGSPAIGADGRRAELALLFRIAIAADRCGFDMSIREADAVELAADRLAADLARGEADAIYARVESGFDAHKAATCNPAGDFARTYRETLGRLAPR